MMYGVSGMLVLMRLYTWSSLRSSSSSSAAREVEDVVVLAAWGVGGVGVSDMDIAM